MVTRAGAFPARKGSRFEAAVVKDQSRLGRLAYRVRRGQGAVVDVLAVEPCRDGPCSLYGARVTHSFAIQAKANGKPPAAEREALIAEAQAAAAIPVLAWPEDGGIRYEVLDDEN
jgi:hypothetical protein